MKRAIVIAMFSTLAVGNVAAQTYEICWHTIDGGGTMFSTGGGFESSGTIGQPDAGSGASGMSGGPFTLNGDFWTRAATARST